MPLSTGIFSNVIHLQKWMLSQSNIAKAKVFTHISMNGGTDISFLILDSSLRHCCRGNTKTLYPADQS